MTTQRSVIAPNVTVRAAIVNNHVKVQSVAGSTNGATDSTKVAKVGDSMTGLLVMTGAAATDYAQKVKASGDIGHRLWVAANGQIGWDYAGTASTPTATMLPWSGTGIGLPQWWNTFAVDGAAYGFSVLAVQTGQNGQPTLVMQSHGGTRAAPTATSSGVTLGEVAFRGCVGGTSYPGVTPGDIGGWSGAAIRGFSVEAWDGFASPQKAGGALTFETVRRSAGVGRTAGMVLFDNGTLALDPATTGLAAVFGNFSTIPTARLYVVSQTTTETTLAVRAITSQTAKAFEVRDASGAVVASIDPAGVAAFASGSTVGGSPISTGGGGGGAPTGASYLTLGTDATLTAERVLTAGTGIVLTDAGAGSTLTVAANIDTDGTLAANSDTKIASQKATKTYADGMIPKSLVDAKGDILIGTADNTVARVAVGSDGKVSKADSTQSAGVAWDYAVPPHGSTKNGSTTYYSTPGFWTVAATTSALVANYCFYFPYWVATPITVDQLAIEQTAAGAAGKLMRFGLIAATKNWQPTGSALADSGNIAADGANGVKTYTPGSPVTLPAGRYLGVIHSDGAPTLRAWAGAGLGDSHPTTLGANVNCFWRVSKALGAIDATAWDTVSTATAMYTQIVLRVSEPTA